LANHKSAFKRARQNEVKRTRNRSYKTRVKKAIREVRSAIEGNTIEQAQLSFTKAVSIIQKTASNGVIHRNQAARKISRLACRINQLASPVPPAAAQ
jgi:small subunit ribosomal protein S20